MKDSEILSTFQELAPESSATASKPAAALVFDACHVGVMLRAVLFVEAVVAVGAMFGSATFLDWLTRLSLLTGGALPATRHTHVLMTAGQKRGRARPATALLPAIRRWARGAQAPARPRGARLARGG